MTTKPEQQGCRECGEVKWHKVGCVFDVSKGSDIGTSPVRDSERGQVDRHEFKSSGRHRQWCQDCPPHDQQPRDAAVHAVEPTTDIDIANSAVALDGNRYPVEPKRQPEPPEKVWIDPRYSTWYSASVPYHSVSYTRSDLANLCPPHAMLDELVEALREVRLMLNTELKQYDSEPWAQRVRAALAKYNAITSVHRCENTIHCNTCEAVYGYSVHRCAALTTAKENSNDA